MKSLLVGAAVLALTFGVACGNKNNDANARAIGTGSEKPAATTSGATAQGTGQSGATQGTGQNLDAGTGNSGSEAGTAGTRATETPKGTMTGAPGSETPAPGENITTKKAHKKPGSH